MLFVVYLISFLAKTRHIAESQCNKLITQEIAQTIYGKTSTEAARYERTQKLREKFP